MYFKTIKLDVAIITQQNCLANSVLSLANIFSLEVADN